MKSDKKTKLKDIWTVCPKRIQGAVIIMLLVLILGILIKNIIIDLFVLLLLMFIYIKYYNWWSK